MGKDANADNAQRPGANSGSGTSMDGVLERHPGAPQIDYSRFRADIDSYVGQDPTPRTAGKLRNELWIADDFDETPSEFLEDL
jgi:hypothetical protein